MQAGISPRWLQNRGRLMFVSWPGPSVGNKTAHGEVKRSGSISFRWPPTVRAKTYGQALSSTRVVPFQSGLATPSAERYACP